MVFNVVVVLAVWTISFISGEAIVACPSGTVSATLSATDGMQSLADAMNCSGQGVFNVILNSSVQISRRIEISSQKIVHITGSGFPTIRAPLRDDNERSVVADAGNTTGIFLVSNGSTLTLNDVVLEGGYAEDGGAIAVLSSSSLHAVGCTFTNNSAATGGAIYARNSEVHIDGTTQFAYNSADFEGGAMYAYGSEVHINGSTSFSHNSVGGVPGFKNETGTIYDPNSTKTYGGALSVESSLVDVSGATFFTNNSAFLHGGAIHARGSQVDISGKTSFVHNFVAGFGGAVYLNFTALSIHGNTSFFNNSALSFGGALSLDQSYAYVNGTTSFSNNYADFGGAVDTSVMSEIAIHGDTSFANNSAATRGGAMHNYYECVVVIVGTTSFIHNSAGDDGGALYTDVNSSVGIAGTTYFTHNSAVGDGGAMYIEYGSVLGIDGSTYFTHNSAVDHGGALYASMHSAVSMDGNTYFAGNLVQYNGGGIYLTGSDLTIGGNASFVDNSAAIGGGIESNTGSLIISVTGMAWFTGNNAIAAGGAISLTAPVEVKISNVTFAANTAKTGGAISVDSTTHNDRRVYENCIFEDNMATDGGAVYFFGGAGLDYVTSSIFRNNFASNGGAVYTAGTLDLVSTIFEANTADKEGMAMLVASPFSSSRVDYTNVSFADNAYHCPRGEYGYDAADANVSRFETVCQGCATTASITPDGVLISTESGTPSCKTLPCGTVGLSSGTTVASLTLEKGYYRTSNESSEIIECYRSEACEGGVHPDEYCAEGYQGAYCSICAEGFSRGFAYSCEACSSTARGSAIGVTLIGAVIVLLLVVALLRSLRAVVDNDTVEENDAPQSLARSTCASCQDFVIRVLPLSAIKIVVVVWQIIYQFSSIAETVYPRQYETFLSYLSFATFDIGVIVWYSCLFSPDFYDRLLLTTIAPLVVLLMLACAYYVAKKYKNSNHGMLVVRDRHISAALFVIFFVYSSVSSTIFQTFRCDPLDDAVEYLRADYRLTCWSAKHKAHMVYASLMAIIYPLGVPLLFVWWLVRNRKHLKMSDRQSVAHLKPFNSIWGTYRPSRYYYEVVECCRRITLSASSVFFIPNSVNQIAIVLSLALVFLFVSESMSPFERKADMGLYRWGNGVILGSMFVALLMKADGSNDESARVSVLGGVLITANVVMIIAVLVESVLLAREWRASMSVAEVFKPPLQRFPSSGLGSTIPAPALMLEDDL